MVSPIITKGFGATQRIVTMGYGGVLSAAVQVARGLVKHGRRRKEEILEEYEKFKISVKLLEVNGKELLKPIINTVTRTIKIEDKEIKVDVKPEQITTNKESRFKVWVSRLRIRRKNSDTD